MKKCNQCLEVKPREAFHNSTAAPDGQYKCKPCVREYKRRWDSENRDRVRAKSMRADIRRYGISFERYQELLAAQGGVCAICGGTDPRGDKLHIDHDHSCCPTVGTSPKACGGCVRGLLCGRCNRGLGMFKDDINLLAVAANYLEGCTAQPPSNVPMEVISTTLPGLGA